jgi:Xaa-Pro aminopeptidase
MISKEEFKARRDKVLSYLAELSRNDKQQYKAVLHSGQQKLFSNDVNYPFRADSNFYYLTGFCEPNAIAVLDPSSSHPFALYVAAKDPEHEIWEGYRAGLEGAIRDYQADIAYEFDDYKEPKAIKDISAFIHSLRSIKSAAELDLMRKSAAIAVQAHQVAHDLITPGIYEYEVEAALLAVFRSQGASGWSYPPIVASGANSCILHYINNDKRIDSDDLILIDAGCEFEYYASDITRVHHASDQMSKQQQDIYDVVLEANKQAIASVKPGQSLANTHQIATNIIAEGLFDLRYIKDKNNTEQIKEFYMHSTGHSLGIDVHDLGVDKKTTKYIPGMVCTIEPAIYIKDKQIGIRIEDDVIVTKDACEVITANLEK